MMASAGAVCGWNKEDEILITDWPRADVEAVDPWPVEVSDIESPSEFSELLDCIEEAEALVSDDDVPLIDPAAMKRAVNFLLNHAELLMQKFRLAMPVPQLGPGPAESVDVHWHVGEWELLVNLPAALSEMAAFYGDDHGQKQIRGTFDPQEFNLGLMAWLIHT